MNISETIIIIFFLALVLITKLPTAYLDYHWDETVFVLQAKFHSINGLFKIPPGRVVHVPLLVYLTAEVFKAAGENPFISHLVVAFFSFAGVYFTYKLGSIIFNEKAGVTGALLLFFSTVYFAISGQFLYEVPLVALTAATLYFALKKKYLYYFISASLLVLTKEPGLLTIAAISLYILLTEKNKIRKFVLHALPAVFLLAWFFWFKSRANYFSFQDAFIQQNLSFTLQRFIAILYENLFWNYLWIISVILVFYFLKNRKVSKPIILLSLSAFAYIVFFSVSPIFLLPRYLLPVSISFFVIAGGVFYDLFKKNHFIILVIIILLFVSTYRFNSGIKGFTQDPIFHRQDIEPLTFVKNGELSLDYSDIVKTETNALNYLFKYHKNYTVLANFPIYEEAAYQISVGNRMWAENGIKVLNISNENFVKNNLLIYESCCFPKNFQEKLKFLVEVKRFQENDKVLIIYKI